MINIKNYIYLNYILVLLNFVILIIIFFYFNKYPTIYYDSKVTSYVKEEQIAEIFSTNKLEQDFKSLYKYLYRSSPVNKNNDDFFDNHFFEKIYINKFKSSCNNINLSKLNSISIWYDPYVFSNKIYKSKKINFNSRRIIFISPNDIDKVQYVDIIQCDRYFIFFPKEY